MQASTQGFNRQAAIKPSRLGMLRSQPTPALNFKRSENWSGWDRSPRLISIRQRRQPRGPTHPPSKFIEVLNEQQDKPVTFHEQMSEVENNAWQNRDEKNELKRRAAIRDDLYQHDLPTDRETVESVELEVERRVNGPSDAPYLEGDQWTRAKETGWIWDQWIAQGFCNVLIAAQKTGKSTFFLSLVAELSKRTGSFLNFSFSEKKEIGFVLIGPDMNRKLWTDYGEKSGLLIEQGNGKLAWASTIQAVYTEETGIGLDPAGIKKIVGHCKEISAKGKHPFVICDSYSALMANSHPNLDENSANYTNPLRKLKRSMGKEGATLLMIHHSSIGGSKRDTATSASGHQNWGRVPDQILTLKWLQSEPGPDGSRSDNRVVLSATGRTGSVAKPQLLEQSPNWGWSSHGDTSDALRHRHALDQRDKLMGDDATLYDLINVRTRNNLGSTIREILELHATTSKSHWSESKTRRLINKLMRKFLVSVSQEVRPEPGDFGQGRPSNIYWTFERAQDETAEALDVPERAGAHNFHVFRHVSATQKPSGGGFSSENATNTQRDPKLDKSPVFHDTEDFLPGEGFIIEDAEGKPLVVVSVVNGAAEILKVRDRFKLDAPIKERRWMVDVFPIGWRAEQQETELYLELEKDVRI